MSAPCQGAVRSGPLVLLRLEGAAMLGVLLAAYASSGHSWWLFAALFLVPDLSMLAYLADARTGAAAYNAVHSTIGPVLLGAAGLLLGASLLPWLAAIWAAHIGFDRMLGYGLKYASGFKDTHLGSIAANDAGATDRSDRSAPRLAIDRDAV